MAILQVFTYPSPVLRQKASKIEKVDDKIRELAENMLETMYASNGVGLAANQVGVTKRILVLDCAREQDAPMVLINPDITQAEGHKKNDEGCLSFPGIFAKVERASSITVEFLDKHGVSQTLQAEGLLAVCIQHEIDHLDGKLFVDHLSPIKKSLIRKKLKKLERLNKRQTATSE